VLDGLLSGRQTLPLRGKSVKLDRARG
jgi:hypothetical protein